MKKFIYVISMVALCFVVQHNACDLRTEWRNFVQMRMFFQAYSADKTHTIYSDIVSQEQNCVFEDQDHVIITLLQSDTVCARLMVSKDAASESAELKMLDVMDDYQRCKLGTFLFSYAQKWAKNKGAQYLVWQFGYLGNSSDSQDYLQAFDKAHAFYTKQGAVAGIYQRDVECPLMSAAHYYKAL